MASTDDFARLASVLGEPPRRQRSSPALEAPKKESKRTPRKEPDRSRDHAVYLAPHRPPAKSIPPPDEATERGAPPSGVALARGDTPTAGSSSGTQRFAIRGAALGALAAVLLAVVGASAFFAIARHF